MIRKAMCSCGQFGIVVEGNPAIVLACNCLKCQRRTGSVFAASSYFDDAQIVERIGESKTLIRSTEAGAQMSRDFCPECGSTVYWKPDITSSHTGIGVGSFADPNFPEPTMSLWNESKHPWVSYPSYWKHADAHTFAD